MHAGPWKSLCRGLGRHSHRTGPDVNAVKRHACMLTNRFWQEACRMSGSVTRPPRLLFYPADFKDSSKIKTNRQPLLTPTSPLDAVKYLRCKHFRRIH